MEGTAFARYKRVAQWYCADPRYRALLNDDPSAALGELGFLGDLDADVAREGARACTFGLFADERYRDNPFVAEFVRRNKATSLRLEDATARARYKDEDVFLFGDTVRNRCRMESAAIRAHTNIRYFPIVFELSEGCRIQCPFCGLSAAPYRASLAYNGSGRDLWRAVLRASRDIVGDVASMASCYFATEPFDNPDYLLFLADFNEICGRFPQTTTAAADRDPKMLRSLMDLEGQDAIVRDNLLRVSVRTLGQFRRIMGEFSPDELGAVELICNNPESVTRYSDSGRARGGSAGVGNMPYSICCVAGARVNMVQKTVEFLEPEVPCDEYPNGVRVRETRGFEDAAGFCTALGELFCAHARGRLPRDAPLVINRNCQVVRDGGCIIFAGDGIRYRLGYNVLLDFALALIEGEGSTFDEIAQRLGLFGPIGDGVYRKLDAVYRRGYLRLA